MALVHYNDITENESYANVNYSVSIFKECFQDGEGEYALTTYFSYSSICQGMTQSHRS